MTAFDFGVLAILSASVMVGMWRGLVSELLALAAWVVGFFAAQATASQVGSVFRDFVRDATIEYVLGFATVLLGVLVVFAVVRMALQGLLAAVGLGVTDRILGSAFGAARAVALIVALVLAGGLTNLPQKPWWREAASAPPLETAALAAKPYLPPQVAKRIRYR